MKKFARTLRNHRELLLNYFLARKAFSSGVIEGLNNKAKVTMRKSYGFPHHPDRGTRAMHLANYPSHSSPTDSSDEPNKFTVGFCSAACRQRIVT